MKKTLFTLCTMALATGAFAQTEAGHLVIGGSSNLGFNTGKTDNDQDDADSQFGLDLNVGYFLMDNLAVGITFGFSSEKTGGADDAFTTMTVGPVVRYYLPMKVFGQVSYEFGSAGADDKTSTSDLGIGIGYAAFLNDHVAIEPMVAYHLTSFKPDGADESVSGSNFGLNIGISVYLGD